MSVSFNFGDCYLWLTRVGRRLYGEFHLHRAPPFVREVDACRGRSWEAVIWELFDD